MSMAEFLLIGQVMMELAWRLLVYCLVVVVASILGILMSGILAYLVGLGY